MADLSQILTSGCIFTDVPGASKKKVLQNISQILSEFSPELPANEVFDHLIARERLGSTGFGNGVAIPHCRLNVCGKITGAFFRLEHPVDFDSVDRKPVDLIFVLLVPEEQTNTHLEVLSQIAELFSKTNTLDQLRSLQSIESIYQEITS